MESKHTLGKWKQGSQIPGDEYSINILGGQYNGIIAKAQSSVYFDYEQAEANAAHIVKCVNAHDELVKALTDLNNKLNAFWNSTPKTDNVIMSICESQKESHRLLSKLSHIQNKETLSPTLQNKYNSLWNK